jgi:SulP family sulfate permease
VTDDDAAKDDVPAVDQPGLAALRSALETAKRRAPSRRTVVNDGAAGLTVAVGSVPDGMANAVLAGVNPVYGLYANIAAPVAGGLLSSSQLMVINSTSAGAIVAGQAVAGVSSADRADALFLLVIVAGVVQLLCGLFGLGRLTRYISFSVMTGFVTGIAVVLGLSQLPTVTGIDADGSNTLSKAFDVLTHPGDIDVASVAIAAVAALLMWSLTATRLNKVAALFAIAVPTAVVAVFGLDSVALVESLGDIPSGLPTPVVPGLSNLSLDVLTGAVSVAVVILVQGSGVSQSISGTEGGPGAISRDFIAQGAANISAGLFRGVPAGGSFKGTTLNASAGGKKRWAAVISGVWTLLIVVAFPGLVSAVALPALGGLLIYVSLQSISRDDITNVWRAGGHARFAAAITFASTVVLPIQIAVLIGVAMAGALYIQESATDLSVVELVEQPDGRVKERKGPRRLPNGEVTVLDVYGHLFYAGAAHLEQLLPTPAGADHPVVVIRLRGQPSLGATVVDVLTRYADEVRSADGRLYLTGLGTQARQHLLRHGRFRDAADVHTFEATPILGESTRRAISDAKSWLLERSDTGGRADDAPEA